MRPFNVSDPRFDCLLCIEDEHTRRVALALLLAATIMHGRLEWQATLSRGDAAGAHAVGDEYRVKDAEARAERIETGLVELVAEMDKRLAAAQARQIGAAL